MKLLLLLFNICIEVLPEEQLIALQGVENKTPQSVMQYLFKKECDRWAARWKLDEGSAAQKQIEPKPQVFGMIHTNWAAYQPKYTILLEFRKSIKKII